MIAAALFFALVAQTPGTDDLSRELTQIREEVAELRASVDALRTKAQFFDQELSKRTAPSEVDFDPSKTGEVRFVSSKGLLFAVAFDAAVAETAGMRVRLHIAPLNSFAVSQLEVSTEWGKRLAPGEDRQAWLRTVKSHSSSALKVLYPDRWNTLDVVLPSALPSDFEFLKVSITSQSVRPYQR